jgi:hypothetical protein
MSIYHDDAKTIKEALKQALKKKDVTKSNLNYRLQDEYADIMAYVQRTIVIDTDGRVQVYGRYEDNGRYDGNVFRLVDSGLTLAASYPAGAYDGYLWSRAVAMYDTDVKLTNHQTAEGRNVLTFVDTWGKCSLYQTLPPKKAAGIFHGIVSAEAT